MLFGVEMLPQSVYLVIGFIAITSPFPLLLASYGHPVDGGRALRNHMHAKVDDPASVALHLEHHLCSYAKAMMSLSGTRRCSFLVGMVSK